MSHPARSPLPDLVEESLGEAVFLWRRWEAELASLTRNLDDIWSWTEDRLHGALAGVRVAGDQVVELATPGLTSDDPYALTVSTYLLASSAAPAAAPTLVKALTSSEPAQLSAMIRALELVGSSAASNRVLGAVASALSANGPLHNAALCRLKTFRRAAAGDELIPTFESNVAEHQAHALRAARHLPEGYVDEWVSAGLRCAHPDVQRAAIESGVSRRIPSAWHAVLGLASRLDAVSGPYLRLVAQLGDAGQQEMVYTSLRSEQTQQQGIWALGHIGTRRAVEACLHGMKHAKLARHAGEAYCHITGADLKRDHLAAEEEPAEVPEFEADDLDADLVGDSSALWPLPDVEAVQRHWASVQSRFQPDARYVRGQPASPATLLHAIETGPMLRRPELVLELAVQSNGRFDVETRAFTQRQRAMLASGRNALGGG
jgi:uncharacterized protein (TIGR02270 family)